MDFQAIRKEYENHGILESELTPTPMPLFRQWYKLAVEKCPGPWFEPNAMALATSDLNGKVTNRIVLLKQVEDDTISFFTNYDSEKGRQLSENPQASVVFNWPYLGRQIRIRGTVARTTRSISETYFHSRPRGSQIGASASLQSSVVSSRQELDSRKSTIEDKHRDQEIPLPDNWGGYNLTPTEIEFWQGRLDRMHDRILYRDDSGWTSVRLSP
ncbi:MAG: pyridoxamine 5'-phosphate oxidase [Mariniblastus sp.]|nr:pyridoxamine 5'-phosphate oxidase [Mariniblastus sp.]MDG2181084.1 pyridoxamine 5'-phosphate oxidase [Mariniblastus sp.]